MQRHVLSVLNDPTLVVDAIWTPILPSDHGITPECRTRLPDPRVRHWWDENRWARRAFREPLKLPERTPAWDVYLVYAPGVRWENKVPPPPTFFMHQLKVLGARGHLHGPTLKAAVERALAAVKAKDR